MAFKRFVQFEQILEMIHVLKTITGTLERLMVARRVSLKRVEWNEPLLQLWLNRPYVCLT